MENKNSKRPKHPEQDHAAKKPAKDEFLITGIGASAGGIQALQEFFRHVPADSGIAYVVILHLSPDHDSKLAEVLQTVAKIPVTQVTEKVVIHPNHVYVVPPNQHLTMQDEEIIVLLNTVTEDRRAPVDIFFRTLADMHGPRAIAVVLSGTGANGSMGLKRIKERGGTAFVQNPREAEFNEMPRNSIATGLVDEVLNVEDIPAKIISYKNSLGTVQITEDGKARPDDQQQALREIFTQMRLRTGHDFSNYKRPTLLRRIERRVNVRALPDLTSYAKYLKEHAEEATALLKDLLISVTNFFRDKRSFEIIETEILPLLLKNKNAESNMRIWIAGCATGEEAYSLAMLCAEKLTGSIDAPRVQIVATDIDESAIAIAREGYYTLNDAADVTPERLIRFFNKEGEHYRIRREIREMIMFATHNFLKDPPFSHLDMVSCRNVLIYLNQAAQERVMETFHFALSPGGYLFLGSSESADSAGDLYASYNREHNIYQSRQTGPRAYPIPESIPALNLSKPGFSHEAEKKALERISFGELHQQLLEQYASPSLVVNEEYEIVHLSQSAGRYLQIGGGEPSQNLLKLIRPELRLELRSALYQSIQRQAAVESRGHKLVIDDKTETVNIHLRPVFNQSDTSRGFILVLFEPATTDESKQGVLLPADEPILKHMEGELIRLKAHLRSSAEQYEIQAEELKASNEELHAMNEELRSTAEELETSKEELQSINEELRTVNQELKIKIEETSITTNNLQNLINSTNIGTIFLDRSFRVVLFTPATRDIFNLIPADYGRPLSDITHRLGYTGFLSDSETVLAKLNMVEKEVQTTDGLDYLMRITPYRTDEDRIRGVVLTFLKITDIKKAGEALRKSEERLRVTMEAALDYAIITIDTEGRIEQWSAGAEKTFTYTEAEVKGKFADIIFTEEDRAAGIPGKEMETAREQGHAADERWHQRKDGTKFYMSGVMRPIYNPSLTGFVKVARDMTPQKMLEQQKDDFISIASHELKTPVTTIKAYTEILGDELAKGDDKEVISIMAKLDNQVNKLTHLINDFLDVTKIDAGGMQLQRESINLNEQIKNVVEDLQRTTQKHTLITKLDKPKTVYADVARMDQVFINLISNAIKYSPDGGDITISTTNNSDHILVCIGDNGIGISKPLQDKIFNRFYRAIKDTYPGMGLGLYIVAEIVKKQGGKIWLNSETGKGSEFCFTIPLEQSKKA